MLEIRRYLTGSGKDAFGAWISRLRDDRTKGKIVARIDRLSLGNFGDCKALGNGLFELRIDWGPATESITRWRAELACCCFAAATNANRRLTSDARWNTSRTTRKGHHETQSEPVPRRSYNS